jgi:chromosome segregation ATPase
MERAELLERLAMVKHHLDQAETRIVEQRNILGQLAHRGANLTKARKLLKTFEKIQDDYLRELDRLLDDLDKIPRTEDDAQS